MLWVLSFHIIFMVAWFAGLFYLPRLFVYHAASNDTVSLDRFKVMERKLYRFIMTPAAILTTVFGLWLLIANWSFYMQADWLHAKLLLVVVLWAYHLYCGHLVKIFRMDHNHLSEKFYRFFNEIPTLLLIAIVILTIVKPF
jgi:protoporphyrinogen IX oxidase